MKVLLTGSRGFVGKGLLRMYPEMIQAPSLRDADQDTVRRLIDETEPDVIVHTAAVSDIGTCEQNPEMSRRANVLLPVYLARASQGIKLICFSSDQVYSGSQAEGPYLESDAIPGNTYAEQKLEMENRVLEICPDAVMLRAEWMYDYPAERPNYISTVLSAGTSLEFSSRQYRGVTWIKEVAESMPAVYQMPGGVYNYGSETNRSIREITEAFLKYLGRSTEITDGPQRHNLWMNCTKAAGCGVRFSEVLEGLKRCAVEYGLC